MPNGGSSLISLLSILFGPGAKFFVAWKMLFSSSRVILEFRIESKCLDGPLLVVSRG